MSEVNPLGGGYGKAGAESHTTVKQQARNWYGIDLKSDGFAEAVVELSHRVESRGQHLVIRDWSFVNFVPYVNNNFKPPNSLLTLEYLKDKLDLLPFAFIRDAIDVAISRGGPLNMFSVPYLRYVEAVIEAGMPIFKYEDFCGNPSQVLRAICSYAKLDYSDSYKNFCRFENVNGDVQKRRRFAETEARAIQLPARKRISTDKIAEIENSPELAKANSLLGYPTSYGEATLEGYWPAFRRTAAQRIKSIVKRTRSRKRTAESV